MDMHDRYRISRQAQKDGGPCPVCGWRDGDGVKVCFYSADLGEVSHQNSRRGAEATMTPAQISLSRLRSVFAFANADVRERYIAYIAWDHERRRQRDEARYPDVPFCVDAEGRPLTTEEWVARFRAEMEAKPLATDEPYCHWAQEPAWIPVGDRPAELCGLVDGSGRTAYNMHCHELHPGCGGTAEPVGPYHIRCTRCGVEVRYWEHGVDYDVG
jgi:hypothetical protein